jgi:type VI secretion system protein ImpC
MPGHLEFELRSAGGKPARRLETSPFVMLVMGDFSASKTKAEISDPAVLMQVPVRNVDIDTLEQLWSVFEPELVIEIEGNPVTFKPEDIDDFHPDQLFHKLPVFAELKQLRKRLLDPATSADALSQVIAAGATPVSDETQASEVPDLEKAEGGEDMFARLLGDRPQHDQPAPVQSQLDGFLQRLVGPHVVYATEPKFEAAIDAVDLATAEGMRKILHHADFQALEGIWRSLYTLVQETELDEQLQLKVCNVTKEQLVAGLPASAESISDSGLYQLLVGRFRRAADDDGFSLLLCNYHFASQANDVALLATLGMLAETQNAAVIAAGESELIGTPSLAKQPAFNEWSKVDTPLWDQLRQSPIASHIGLVLPRILGRLPYGAETEPVDSFDFEELANRDHDNFLWVNPVLACGRLLAQGFTEQGWHMQPDDQRDIGNLPAYSYQQDGEQKLLPCAELLLPERSAEAMLELGIMPIVSFRNRDMARLLRFQSISSPLSALKGPWQG